MFNVLSKYSNNSDRQFILKWYFFTKTFSDIIVFLLWWFSCWVMLQDFQTAYKIENIILMVINIKCLKCRRGKSKNIIICRLRFPVFPSLHGLMNLFFFLWPFPSITMHRYICTINRRTSDRIGTSSSSATDTQFIRVRTEFISRACGRG